MFIPLGTLGNIFTTIIDTFDRASLGTQTTTGHKLTQLRQTWTTASSSYATSSAAANTYPLLTVDVEQTDQVSGTFTNRYLGNGPAFWVTDANNWWAAISNMRVVLDRNLVTTCSGNSCPPCSTSSSSTTAYTCPPCSTSTVNNGCGCYGGYFDNGIGCVDPDSLQTYPYCTTTVCNAPCSVPTTICNTPCNCSSYYTDYSYYTDIKIIRFQSGTISTYSSDVIVNAASYDLANIPNYISVVTRNDQITVRAFNNSNVLMGSALTKNVTSPTKGNYAGIAYGGSDYNPNGAFSLYYNATRPTS